MDGCLYILTGPTAVGKTELSLQWAIANRAEILSCDSVQLYQEMDIGSAKPSPEDMQRVPHYGIDIQHPARPYNVRAYVEYAKEAIKRIQERGRQVLITGGSGFYLKSFFGPVVDDIDVPERIQREVTALFERGGLNALVDELLRWNPEGVKTVDLANPRRVSKALERSMATHRQVDELRAEFLKQKTPFDDYKKKLVLLTREPENLRKRVDLRVRQMLAYGLVREVDKLKKLGFESNPSASSAIGYAQTLNWMNARGAPLEELHGSIVHATMNLVKKQHTWFRTQLPNAIEINLDENPYPDLQLLFEE